jgi:hypothetical protein
MALSMPRLDSMMRNVRQATSSLGSRITQQVKARTSSITSKVTTSGSRTSTTTVRRTTVQLGSGSVRVVTSSNAQRLQDGFRTTHQTGGQVNQAPRRPVEEPDSAQPGRGWKGIPHINQLQPRGRSEAGYTDGHLKCGPAAVAMLARGLGRMDHLSDAQLIDKLGEGVLTPNGTSLQGVGTMLERVGARIAGNEVLAGRFDSDFIDKHLGQGHKLIAQVGHYEPKTDITNAHYVVVTGRAKNGDYIIKDPLHPAPYAMSSTELKRALKSAPGTGGAVIPVSSRLAANADAFEERGRLRPDTGAPRVSEMITSGKDRRIENRRPITPRGSAPGEMADRVLRLIRSEDRTMKRRGQDLLTKLENSGFPADRQAFRQVSAAMGRQPGVGQKIQVDPF